MVVMMVVLYVVLGARAGRFPNPEVPCLMCRARAFGECPKVMRTYTTVLYVEHVIRDNHLLFHCL